MATSTENFKFKKPDESNFYDVQDQNGNWDIADQELEKLNNPTFEDYTGDTSVPAASAAIEELRSKSKLGVLLSNIKAAFKGACLIGHIVNNCVTDRSDLPLSAAQGKALMDLYNVLNTKRPYAITGNTTIQVDGNNLKSDVVSFTLKDGYTVGAVTVYGVTGSGTINILNIGSDKFSYFVRNIGDGATTYNIYWTIMAICK